ncbi:WXG100 family type VII secretion target [Nocardia mangyaensis]|uniref:WXG100 family type VII secretion target n=1 Tax=Nocardia mangyaensis TaxID=2213200 RepID=UPI002676C66E|nr:WXG100 family type VII secretion target [Nocardia mangyaensis]MDO3650541.1 WXG100 family type VII secretion target [Nocardia mangyaensis]
MVTEVDGGKDFAVIPDDVQGFGRAAYRIAEELRSASASLDTEIQGLMSTWKGAAADSYVAGWDEMHRGALDVWDTLFALAEQLGITAQSFRELDHARAAAVSSLDLP